jgi:hypothetical protein
MMVHPHRLRIRRQKDLYSQSCPIGLLYLYLYRFMKFRTITIYKHYFPEFFSKQRQKVKDKIIWTFKLIEEIQHVPESYLKHMEGT